jgi:opacity protein-like surface antigen
MRIRTNLLLLLFCLFSYTLQAQNFAQGTHYFGTASGGADNIFFSSPLVVNGGLGEMSLSANDPGFLALVVSPEYGRFVTDRLLVGSGLSFTVLTDFEDGSSLLGLTPFARYYFGQADSPWQWFGEARIAYSRQLDSPGTDAFGLGIRGGATYFLQPNVGLDLSLGYVDNDLSNDRSASLAASAGLRFYVDDAPWRSSISAPGFGIGTIMVGGSVGQFSIGLNEFQSTGITLQPQLHYFLTDRLAVGTGLEVGHSFRKFRTFVGGSPTEGDIRSLVLGVSPQLRYYLGEAGTPRRWFLGAGIEVQYENVEVDPSVFGTTFFGSSEETSTNFAVGAGLNQFINRKVALEIGPTLRIEPETETVRFGVDLGVQVFLRN